MFLVSSFGLKDSVAVIASHYRGEVISGATIEICHGLPASAGIVSSPSILSPFLAMTAILYVEPFDKLRAGVKRGANFGFRITK